MVEEEEEEEESSAVLLLGGSVLRISNSIAEYYTAVHTS